MSLRQSPTRTPAFLAANRRNARKCTGPRTVAGKARSSLNSFKHGDRTQGLEARLLAAGDRGGAELRRQIGQEIREAFAIQGKRELRQAERMADRGYGVLRWAENLRTKPEYPLFSARLNPRSSSLVPFRIADHRNRLILVYWVQRRKFWTMEKLMAELFHPTTVQYPPLGRRLEGRLRRRLFLMRRPGLWERQAYGLDERGMPDPAQRVRKNLLRIGESKFDGRWRRFDGADDLGGRPAQGPAAVAPGGM